MGDSDSSTLDKSAAVALTGKIMVISIIVLFVVVVFVLLLHVYAKWFWWRIEEDDSTHTQQRPRRGRFVFAPGQQLAVASGWRGLDTNILKSLPDQIFQAKDFEEGLECAVCLCELEEGEKVRFLPKCNHGFHLQCINMWFQSHSTCPICRNPVAADFSGVDSMECRIQQEGIFRSVEDNFDEVGGHESPNFPTNVLFWGNESEVNTRNASCSVVEGPSSSSATSSSVVANDSMLVIDIPRQILEELPCSSPSPGSELKSPMAIRLRSLRRLLSGGDRKVSSSSQRNCADDDAMV